ncbi:MAG: (4Fe-4S)-binding protein [Bacteroidia bacterium]
MEKETTIHYKNSDITVVWKPHVCIHSKKCWKELGDVFKPLEKPWVKMEGASTERIIKQVDSCPSGALSYIKNK